MTLLHRTNVQLISSVVLTALVLSAVIVTPLEASSGNYKVTIQNVSPTVITPPAIALTRDRDLSFFEVGESASVALEKLAEGGDTSDLIDLLNDAGASTAAHDAPIGPGESIELSLNGRSSGYFHLATMLLPTNDAFAAIDGERVRGRGPLTFYAHSYDAGTEANTETEATIPGLFPGEGFNAERDDVDFIHPHPGLHGTGEIDHAVYDWRGPVVKVTIERMR